MNFIGIGRTFSTVGEAQYDTIGAFWDELSARYGLEKLRGLGHNWTKDTMDYVIGLKEGEIEGWDTAVPLPDTGWVQREGRTEKLADLYEEIYRDGPLRYEIESFDSAGNCCIRYTRETI